MKVRQCKDGWQILRLDGTVFASGSIADVPKLLYWLNACGMVEVVEDKRFKIAVSFGSLTPSKA
jgi:hypothetical protein